MIFEVILGTIDAIKYRILTGKMYLSFKMNYQKFILQLIYFNSTRKAQICIIVK